MNNTQVQLVSSSLVRNTFSLALKVLVTDIDALERFKKRDKHSTVGGDGDCRINKVRAGTTSPMPDHKGFKLQWLSDSPTPFTMNDQKFSSLKVKHQ